MKSFPVPVIMCNWRRTHRLPTIFQQLAAQHDVDVHLYIWNNNNADRDQIDEMIADVPASLTVTVRHSPENIGGFGRFYYARELASRFPFVIFIDDDQELPPDTIATLVGEYEPRTIKGQHAFNFASQASYWLRLPARRGKRATYVGTCGMIAESSIFTDPRLFECPQEYWFIEDLWLCYVAEQYHGWRLSRSRVRMKFTIDTKNQFAGLMSKKGQFLRYLVSAGWQVQGRLWE